MNTNDIDLHPQHPEQGQPFSSDPSSSSLLSGLNPAQLEAVTTTSETTLVIAGAGSGKTRVLTHRIAWLLTEHRVPLHQIMAVTFTNKAAAEMHDRIKNMLGTNISNSGIWLGTFHSLAHRFLRTHWQEAKLNQNFQIIDADDQLRILKRIHKELNLSEDKHPPKKIQLFINKNKERCLRHHNIKPSSQDDLPFIDAYRIYSEFCLRGNLVDFSELLLRMHETLQECPDLLATYKQRFKHILVDEFQDTNSIQYLWVRALALDSANFMAVGDDDQSIYGWRGANVENIQHLINDFRNTKIIRLEQNYRSTSNILQAANAVIANNCERLGKNLWTQGNDGELITLHTASNEAYEAEYVVKEIKNIKNLSNKNEDSNNSRLENIAILYRSNAQSRLFEEELTRQQIPYRIYGGLRFFERAEIKDALAYLRVTINPDDDAALERIINVPTRGIGETTLLQLRNYANLQKISIFSALRDMLEKKMFNATRTIGALHNFLALLTALRSKISEHALSEFVDYTIKTSGLHAHFSAEKTERNLMRLDNLAELVSATTQFELCQEAASEANGQAPIYRDPDATTLLLSSFLTNIALDSSGDSNEQNQGQPDGSKAAKDCVQLMTLHAAKGLEFHTVFLCGMEDGLFPHGMSLSPGSTTGLEEERRLCYVGITRAKSKLYCTHALSRSLHGNRMSRQPSRFIAEIPGKLLKESRDTALTVSPYNYGKYSEQSAYNDGDSGWNTYDRNNAFYEEGKNKKNAPQSFRNTRAPLSLGSSMQKKSGLSSTTSLNEREGFKIGEKVKHQKFGKGVIIDFDGDGKGLLISVKFTNTGVKQLSPLYAKLEKE